MDVALHGLTSHRLARPFLLAALAAAVTAAPAVARQETAAEPAPAADSSWGVQMTPYVWASGMAADVSPFRRAPTIRTEKPFGEVLPDLNGAAFVNLLVRKHRFVFSGDAMFVSLTEAKVVGALPIVGPIPPISATLDTTQFTSTLLAGYRLVEAPAFTFDVLGGARLWHLSNGVEVSAIGESRRLEEAFGWGDPVVAARGVIRLTDKVSALLYGDVGAGASEATWRLLATLNYSFTRRWTISGGYNAIGVDYSSDDHVFDAVLSGPAVGLTIRF